MNGVDYTRKLDRERELFRKTIKDNNRGNKEHLEAMKASFDHKTESQQTAHSKQKMQLEKNFNDRYDILNTIGTTLLIDFSLGIFNQMKIIYDKTDINLNQNLVVIVKQTNEKHYFKNLTALKINKGIKYECLALKK